MMISEAKEIITGSGISKSSYVLHWSRVRCSCLLRGRLGDVLDFHPLKSCFKPKFKFCKLSSYSRPESLVATRQVSICYVCPVEGVHASYGAV